MTSNGNRRFDLRCSGNLLGMIRKSQHVDANERTNHGLGTHSKLTKLCCCISGFDTLMMMILSLISPLCLLKDSYIVARAKISARAPNPLDHTVAMYKTIPRSPRLSSQSSHKRKVNKADLASTQCIPRSEYHYFSSAIMPVLGDDPPPPEHVTDTGYLDGHDPPDCATRGCSGGGTSTKHGPTGPGVYYSKTV